MLATNQDLIDSLAIARTWSASRWSSWLIDAFHRNRTAPLWLGSHGDLIREIDRLFLIAEEDIRRSIKAGLVRAIREWESDLYGAQSYRILQQLCWTAARLRATDVVPHISGLLIRHHSELRFSDGPFFTAADAIAAVLAGFAPDPEVEQLFDTLLFDDAITPHLGSTFAVGLCLCKPSRFPEAFARYFQLRTRASGHFKDEEIVMQFEAAITHRGLTQMLHRLPIPAQQYLIHTALTAKLLTVGELIGFDVPRDEDSRGDALPIDNTRQVPEQTRMRYRETLQRARAEAKADLEVGPVPMTSGSVQFKHDFHTPELEGDSARATSDFVLAGTTDVILAGLTARARRIDVASEDSSEAQDARTEHRTGSRN